MSSHLSPISDVFRHFVKSLDKTVSKLSHSQFAVAKEHVEFTAVQSAFEAHGQINASVTMVGDDGKVVKLMFFVIKYNFLF